jgi:SOS-response transcriptional repressor LexA
MARGHALLARYLTKIRQFLHGYSNSPELPARIGVQIDASLTGPSYSIWNRVVKQIIPFSVETSTRSEVALAVRRLRKALGFSQAQLASALGTLQGQVAKWETDALKPSGQMCVALSKLAAPDEREWWLRRVGLSEEVPAETMDNVRSVPLLKDSMAAGTPRAVDESEVEAMIGLPANMLPRGGKLFAVRVTGDSMAPVILDGFLVIVDTGSRDPSRLVEQMVVARDDDGVTVKWLRRDGDLYLLVPQHTSPLYPVRILRLSEGHGIVGSVVMWIGEPPKPRKRR